jgi:NAD(P)-dependent dehydrogenase (short-subunit alcohol dehydrogenase family)
LLNPFAAAAPAPLSQLRVLVTGASRGLGRGLTESLLRRGATVLALARSGGDLEELARTMQAHPAPSGRLLLQVGSMLDGPVLEHALQQLQAQAGGLDLLIANAGVYGPRAAFQAADSAAWEEALLLNTLGLSRCCRACIPALAAADRGQILIVGSAIGHTQARHSSAYAASKALSWSLVKCLSLDLEPLGIAVNELIPGPVHTAMNPQADKLPFCRQPHDPAFVDLITYLCASPGRPPSGQSFSLRISP